MKIFCRRLVGMLSPKMTFLVTGRLRSNTIEMGQDEIWEAIAQQALAMLPVAGLFLK